MHRLKMYLLVAWLNFGLQDAWAQGFRPMDAGSVVEFSINNFGSPVRGSFSGLRGRIEFDPSRLPAGEMEVSVEAKSIMTGIGMRDRHLRGDKYFAVEQYPRILVRGNAIRAGRGEGNYIMDAEVRIRSTVRKIELPFKAVRQAGGWLFEGSFRINRRDFGVGGSSISLSDEVTVHLKVLAGH